MTTPSFLLQSGNILPTEKLACISSDYLCTYCKFENLGDLPKVPMQVPVGSVEFVEKFAELRGIALPAESLSYACGSDKFLKRKVRRGVLSEASPEEFVKPVGVKKFTGDIRKNIRPLSPQTPVWISEPVEFTAEYRFYVQDTVSQAFIPIVGRYDCYDSKPPNPKKALDLALNLANEIHQNLGPSAYSIDIGYRPDINDYDLVEVNDAWALGLYPDSAEFENHEPVGPNYVEMLISRWRQLVFCSIVDKDQRLVVE